MRTDFLHKAAGAASMAEELIKIPGAMTVKIAATDPAYLTGTYSQAFIREMALQLTAQIESRLMVSGLAKSDIALELVFAPGTYMEHPQGEYTYRRLLVSESGRAIKDLWIRWQRVGEGRNFTVCDDVTGADIRFSLGEDVPQKVREKEYRFLVQADAEQYRTAMGRKNVTEWREIIKRAVKRGTLEKLTIDDKVAEHAGQIKDKLEELLGKITPAPAPQEEPAAEPEKDEAYEKAMAYMRSFVESNGAKAAAEEEEEEISALSETAEEELPAMPEKTEEIAETEPISEEADEEDELFAELTEEAPVEEAPAVVHSVAPAVDLDALRAEMESQLRAQMAERERELLRRESALEQQKLALAAEIKEHEMNRAERENELRRQAQNQARLEWEAKERDRLTAQAKEAIEARKAEEARLAEEARKAEEARLVEEARKAEEARLAEEARKAEEIRLAEEARKAEEARLAEEARKAEEARLAEEARKAEEARLAEEARKAEEARLAEEARKAAESRYIPETKEEMEARLAEEACAAVEARFAQEMRMAEEERRAQSAPEPAEPVSYTYTEKLVHLIFRHPVDPNVMTRIHELMSDTIRYFKKESVFIKVKASIPSEDTVDLHFTQFPEEERQLLIDMIQVLGNSDLGIGRVVVD